MSSRNEFPSHQAIDNFNAAPQHPKYLVLDDTNVDLITFFLTIGAFISTLLTNFPLWKIIASAIIIIIPLRSLFPRPTTPTGLVLITGASSGIGAELSYIFASKSHDIILVGRNEEQLHQVSQNIQEKYQRKTYIFSQDLSLPRAGKELYEKVKNEGLVVDILVNNAALGHAGDVVDQDDELPERMIGLNCISFTVLTQLFAKDMVKRGRGWILQTSSIAGWMASPGQNIYHATKHYVRSFSEALSIELRGTNVHLTQLLPGPVATQFVTRAHLDKTFTFSSSGSVEDPRDVAKAGYDGLINGRRMVFSSWNSASMGFLFWVMPRCLHVTVAGLMNSPTEGRMEEPLKDQKERF